MLHSKVSTTWIACEVQRVWNGHTSELSVRKGNKGGRVSPVVGSGAVTLLGARTRGIQRPSYVGRKAVAQQ